MGPCLPIGNLQTDERAFAVLDGGCNFTFHTSACAEKASQTLFVPEDIVTVAGPAEDQPRYRRRQVHRQG